MLLLATPTPDEPSAKVLPLKARLKVLLEAKAIPLLPVYVVFT